MTFNFIKYRIYELGGPLDEIDGWDKVVAESDVVVLILDEFGDGERRLKKTKKFLEKTSRVVKERGIPTAIIGNKMPEVNDNAVEALAAPYLKDARTYHTSITTVTDQRLTACMEWIESVAT